MLEIGLDPGSMAQTEDKHPNRESSPTAMSSLGDEEGNPDANELSQQFNSHGNSQRDAEEEIRCLKPNPSHKDHAGQASNGKIQKDREPMPIPVETAKSKLDQQGTSAEACIGKKRKAREQKFLRKEQQETERKKKKREIDKNYRAKNRMRLNELETIRPQYDRLMEIALRFGGIDQMESYINQSNSMKSESLGLPQKEVADHMFRKLIETELCHPGQLKSKHGGIDKMDSMLVKFKDMEAESHKLNQIKSKLGIQETESLPEKFKEMEAELRKLDQIKLSFGGIDEIESGVNRFKKIELQLEKLKQMVNEEELESRLASPGSQQEKRGSQSLDLSGDYKMVSDQRGSSLISSAAVSGPMLDMQYYSDELLDQLIARLTDENFRSNLDLDGSFKDSLEGECESVNKFKIPQFLVSTALNIFKFYGDITKESKYIDPIVQTIFVFFCAAIKEMGDRSLEEVTEDLIWKWRGPIMDAKRSGFDVEFAIKHLETIVQGYFGLKALKDRDSMDQRIVSLRADEEALRKELGKKSNEIKALEAKQIDLTSEKGKVCQEATNKFLGKMVGMF